MATAKKTTAKVAKAKASVTTADAKKAIEDKELVAEAAIDVVVEDEIPANDENKEADHLKAEEESPAPAPKEDAPISDDVIVLNTSYNEILLNTGILGLSVRIAPKERKTVSRHVLRDLLKNKIVRRWFDKGILTSNMDANETDANEAKTPENLKGPVERTDSVSTISAKVTKFKADGKVQINL